MTSQRDCDDNLVFGLLLPGTDWFSLQRTAKIKCMSYRLYDTEHACVRTRVHVRTHAHYRHACTYLKSEDSILR